MDNQVNSGNFLKLLLKRLQPSIILVVLVVIVYVYIMQYVDHEPSIVSYFVIFLALIKTVYFTFFTFKQVNKSIKYSHSFGHLLWVFGLLVILIVFSFAADFTCLIAANISSFHIEGLNTNNSFSYYKTLFETSYFSIVTFAGIGYGDIVPVSTSAKILVIMEISQSFVLVVFSLSNINNICIKIKNQ